MDGVQPEKGNDENTVYHNGDYRLYPTIIGLNQLIKKIIEAKATTKYIRITPFYKNAKADRQIEFDEYMFYLECREEFDKNIFESHIGECWGKVHKLLSNEEINLGKVLFPLCVDGDIETFKKSLQTYIEFWQS